MAIATQTSSDGREVKIAVSGRFDFNAHREFRDAVKDAAKGARYVVDMGEATYVDSSALGMLLLLKDESSDVKIVGCSDEVKKVLEIANFHRLFDVS